ncbi:Dyp-type peroxidase [Corynebacterium liangguodongii]|uniref:Peroxidase n=1 Tax=Corynebacterium liangguodongii TaxID=2079535 RepID=A0A2S0WEF8_9CORY|nr:Dyp-type peroxidase [Corynebacterium liangguodongii]AWB84130.1 peroxidase [Corynebacterium liangguodongii]PWC00141.1 Dyp-type peroxidase [Corynebacterium liangguodongii]
MKLKRRAFIAGASAAGAAALAGCAARGEEEAARAEPTVPAVVDFDGAHQAGIVTRTQAALYLAGYNLRSRVDAPGFARLLRLLTADARALCAGEAPLGSLEPEMSRNPAALTVTCGIGERAFDIAAPEKKPAWLRDLPAFRRDQLDPAWGQTDVVLQICSDDPLTAAWALRHLTRAAADYATTAWVQQGFSQASGEATPRNMFGQVDGTVNPVSEDDYAAQVFADGPAGFAGGSSMVVRRIAMHLDEWELLDRASREQVIGRTLDTGAPLTGGGEFTAPDLRATDRFGLPVIDKNSHMARAMPPADHPEQRFKRRPYNYVLPPEPGSARLSNVGQIFIAYQKDPVAQFVPVQARLDEVDRLNTWITHIGSAVYWVPPGTSASGESEQYWGQSVFGSPRG